VLPDLGLLHTCRMQARAANDAQQASQPDNQARDGGGHEHSQAEGITHSGVAEASAATGVEPVDSHGELLGAAAAALPMEGVERDASLDDDVLVDGLGQLAAAVGNVDLDTGSDDDAGTLPASSHLQDGQGAVDQPMPEVMGGSGGQHAQRAADARRRQADNQLRSRQYTARRAKLFKASSNVVSRAPFWSALSYTSNGVLPSLQADGAIAHNMPRRTLRLLEGFISQLHSNDSVERLAAIHHLEGTPFSIPQPEPWLHLQPGSVIASLHQYARVVGLDDNERDTMVNLYISKLEGVAAADAHTAVDIINSYWEAWDGEHDIFQPGPPSVQPLKGKKYAKLLKLLKPRFSCLIQHLKDCRKQQQHPGTMSEPGDEPGHDMQGVAVAGGEQQPQHVALPLPHPTQAPEQYSVLFMGQGSRGAAELASVAPLATALPSQQLALTFEQQQQQTLRMQSLPLIPLSLLARHAPQVSSGAGAASNAAQEPQQELRTLAPEIMLQLPATNLQISHPPAASTLHSTLGTPVVQVESQPPPQQQQAVLPGVQSAVNRRRRRQANPDLPEIPVTASIDPALYQALENVGRQLDPMVRRDVQLVLCFMLQTSLSFACMVLPSPLRFVTAHVYLSQVGSQEQPTSAALPVVGVMLVAG
jgi:hypothetical protein